MCNLYRLRRSAEEVASFFGVKPGVAAFNVPDDILPAYPGLVAARTLASGCSKAWSGDFRSG